MKKILDDFQEKILNFLELNQDSSDEGITLRDIANAVGIDHPQKVANKLQQLENKGFIRKLSNGIYKIIKKFSNDIVYLPLYWFAQCGIKWPEIIEEYPKEYLPFTNSIIRNSNDNYIAVKAKWKSMEPEISSWDTVIIKIQEGFNINDMVLVSHNNEAKIKQIKSINNKYHLHSLNKNFKDIEIIEKDDLKIIGVVEKIVRSRK